MKGLLFAVGSLSLSLLISEANAKNPRHFKDLSAFHPTYYTTPKGIQMAKAEVILERTQNGWKPMAKTGKRTPTFSNEYLARFHPSFIDENRALINATFKQTKKGWSIIRPRSSPQPQ